MAVWGGARSACAKLVTALLVIVICQDNDGVQSPKTQHMSREHGLDKATVGTCLPNSVNPTDRTYHTGPYINKGYETRNNSKPSAVAARCTACSCSGILSSAVRRAPQVWRTTYADSVCKSKHKADRHPAYCSLSVHLGQLDFNIDASWQVQSHKGVDHLQRRVSHIDKTRMGPNLEVFTGIFVDVRGAKDTENLPPCR